MLHSDDADINKVIREIIELDKKATRIKKNVSEKADKILENTDINIKANEATEIKKIQDQGQTNYESEINKAKDERLAIINAKEQELVEIRRKYDAEKEEKAMGILAELFKNPVKIMNK
ncbi:MAG: hypothetical protein L6276_00080 [Acetobacterium sp.]|nr:hypothetical protein [Bacillota bacterium]MCG2728681.1 hypothetical protein [Acetobacterium sp.]